MLDKLSNEARLLIAFLLMGVVLLVSQYVIPQPEPPPPAQKAKTEAPVASTPPPAEQPAPGAAPAASPATGGDVPGKVAAQAEETNTIDTTRHHVVFSNRGAVVRSWVLKGYTDSAGKPLDLVNPKAFELTGNKALPAPFAFNFKGQAPSNNPNDDLFRVESFENGMGLNFEFSDGRTSSKKTFRFREDSYLVDVTSQVMENGVAIAHGLTWRGGFGDETVSNVVSDSFSLYFDTANNSLKKNNADAAEDGAISNSGSFGLAGIEDKYFAAVALPPQGGTVELTTFTDLVPGKEGKEEQRVGIAMGGSGANSFPMYVGPKDEDILRTVDARLEQLIDWGWFWFLAKPLFFALTWINGQMVHNYGWAVVLLTIGVNLLFVPLRMTQMKSARKMQSLQPQINAINEKVKGLPATDPRKQRAQQEVMEVWKREGVNPLSGCLPMLLQIPFFFALYKVLNIAIEMRGADWLWVSDLSQPETLPIRILPVLLVVTQFLSQKMTPSPGMDPAQQKMMLFMPLVFGYMFYFFASGLVLYWLTSNVVSIVQQLLLNRRGPAPAPAVVDVKPVPKKKR